MSELIAIRVYLAALGAHVREIGDDERGEMSIEPLILTTAVVGLAFIVVVLGVLKLTRLFAGS
jgi:hypothetical protein